MAKENNPEIPTEEEIALLPQWAQVAFAARCARRVQPLFVHDWPDAPQKHIDNIDKAITLAESSAASHTSSASAAASAASAADAAAAVDADDAAYAAYVAYASSSATSAYSAYYASAASSSASSASAVVNVGIRADFELLNGLAQREKWDKDTPVPPEVFGPMWPDGMPEGWPESGIDVVSEDGGIEIELIVDENATDEEIFEAASKIAAAASKVHCAYGGHGLKIQDIEIEREVPIRVEVQV